MASRPLTARQRQAAILVGSGVSKSQAAVDVGVSRRSVQAWAQREDWQRLAQQHREALLEQAPDAAATLTAALSAVKSDGSPDHAIRVKAAAILITGKVERPSQPQAQEIVFHTDGDDPDLVDDDRPGLAINRNGG